MSNLKSNSNATPYPVGEPIVLALALGLYDDARKRRACWLAGTLLKRVAYLHE